jgi:hypothetical protein
MNQIKKAQLKEVCYAYPTSQYASKFGFGKTGCYVVATSRSIGVFRAVAGFITRDEAKAFADTIPCAYSRYSI